MIVIGSQALHLHGIHLRKSIDDLDLIGTPEEVDGFRARHAADIVSERTVHGHRHAFVMAPGFPFRKVEIDVEGSPSDAMLARLCTQVVDVVGERVALPSVETLFLIKRAHANVPVHYDKTIRDIIRLKPLLGPLSEDQVAFYKQRQQECRERYRLNRQRFSLSVPNDDFFALSDHVRLYVHDDLHEVVAFRPGEPLYKRCKRDLSLAKIDVDLFERLSPADRLRMVQEEFMVIGLERFYLHDRSLSPAAVYAKGMHKTIRDLFVGYFQDFCIDHIALLAAVPPHDFVARFEKAEAEGRLRKVEIPVPELTDEHRQALQALRDGRLDDARRISEDLARRSAAGGDPHALFYLGVVLFRQRNWALAERMLRQSLSRHRENPPCLFHLGALCRITGRHAEARRLLEAAIDRGFRNRTVYLNLGKACEGLQAREDALAAYRSALQHAGSGAQEIRARIEALETPEATDAAVR